MEDYKLIELRGKHVKGKFAKVSPHRYDYLSQFKCFVCAGYAYRSYGKGKSKGVSIAMHREIMGFPTELDVDHADRDRLNNTDENLRLATKTQNMLNRNPINGKTKKYSGIMYNEKLDRWFAKIAYKTNEEKKTITLGAFKNKEEAIRHRDSAALHFHGEFACLFRPDLVTIPYKETIYDKTKPIYKGVIKNAKTRKWDAYYEEQKIGSFGSQEEAARRVDWFLFKDNKELNCPNKSPIETIMNNYTSKYDGVSFCSGKWLAALWEYNGVVFIGTFETEELAHEAVENYKRKTLII